MADADYRTDPRTRYNSVCEFLFLEAGHLDNGRYEEWNDLLADDIVYRVPEAEFVDRPNRSLDDFGAHHFDEDKRSITNRVTYLMSGLNSSDMPRLRRARLITNIRIASQSGAEMDVHSNFLLMQYRWDGTEVNYAGSRVDRLREAGAGLKLARRDVSLLNVILPRSITTFF